MSMGCRDTEDTEIKIHILIIHYRSFLAPSVLNPGLKK